MSASMSRRVERSNLDVVPGDPFYPLNRDAVAAREVDQGGSLIPARLQAICPDIDNPCPRGDSSEDVLPAKHESRLKNNCSCFGYLMQFQSITKKAPDCERSWIQKDRKNSREQGKSG